MDPLPASPKSTTSLRKSLGVFMVDLGEVQKAEGVRISNA
jgi:hypothetical protein